MKDNFGKEIIIGGVMSLVGYIIGLVTFVVLGIKQGIFISMVDNLKEWDMLAMVDLFDKYKVPLSTIMISWFLIFLLFFGVAYVINNKFLKNKKMTPWLFILGFTTFIGFLFIPFVIFLVGLILSIIYIVWGVAEFINLFLFGYIAYIFFIAIDFVFNKILSQELNLIKFNQDNKYMFFQIIIFFSLLPYTFRCIAVGFENILSKISGKIASFLLKPLRFLSINFFRYVTYTFAFFTYLMIFLWEVSGSINVIKEGLLAFIIIDVVIFGVYNSVVKKKKKSIILICISLSRDLELIKNEIIRYNLFSYDNCKVLIKQTIVMEKFNKKVKKRSDEKLVIIYERIIRVSRENPNYKGFDGLSFKELYIEINRIQELIDEYIVG